MVDETKDPNDPYGLKFKKLDYRTQVKCPCLKGTLMIGTCRLICKFYKLNKYGEQCEYSIVEGW